MTVSVDLIPEFQSNYTIGSHVGFRLTVTATNGVGIDEHIFRYFRRPDGSDYFSGVCSWPDMEELPVDAPGEDDDPPAFRKDSIDIVVSSESVATDVWETIKDQADELCQTVYDGETLSIGDSYTASSS